jgi:hypothetical protein
MFQLSAISVAVQNALPSVKEYATLLLNETNQQGGAGRMIDYIVSQRTSSTKLNSPLNKQTNKKTMKKEPQQTNNRIDLLRQCKILR